MTSQSKISKGSEVKSSQKTVASRKAESISSQSMSLNPSNNMSSSLSKNMDSISSSSKKISAIPYTFPSNMQVTWYTYNKATDVMFKTTINENTMMEVQFIKYIKQI